MSATGISAIRYFSFMNKWLDFVVTVPDEFVEPASQIIKEALDQFEGFLEDRDSFMNLFRTLGCTFKELNFK